MGKVAPVEPTLLQLYLALPWYVRAFAAFMFFCVAWTALGRIEAHYNPAHFDLEMLQRIDETQKIVEQSLEDRTSD